MKISDSEQSVNVFNLNVRHFANLILRKCHTYRIIRRDRFSFYLRVVKKRLIAVSGVADGVSFNSAEIIITD